MILEKKCLTKWRAVCGTANIRMTAERHNTGRGDDVVWKSAESRVERATKMAKGLGADIMLDKADFIDLLDRFKGEAFMRRDAHIQTKDTYPLETVFARMEEEYGVKVDFTEKVPVEAAGVCTLDPGFKAPVSVPITIGLDLTAYDPKRGNHGPTIARYIEEATKRGILNPPDDGVAIPVSDHSWHVRLRVALESIPGVKVESMDVDFEKEKMHLVLDHPDKDEHNEPMRDAVSKAIRDGAAEKFWRAGTTALVYWDNCSWDWSKAKPEPETDAAFRERIWAKNDKLLTHHQKEVLTATGSCLDRIGGYLNMARHTS